MIFKINEKEVTINIEEFLNNSGSENAIKVFNLRLYIFWKKIYVYNQANRISKEKLCVELFDFLSMIICLLNKSVLSRFAKLVIILFIIFHFEQMLDKFEQIDYKDYTSIRLMLPLYNSKAIIVEDLVKTCYPEFRKYSAQDEVLSTLDSLFIVPNVDSLITPTDKADGLISSEEKAQIEECLLNCTKPSIKEGIREILNFSGFSEVLITLYYKCLSQLKTMCQLCKTPTIGDINKSTGRYMTICRMQRSKEVIYLKILRMIQFLPEKDQKSELQSMEFSCINMNWPDLYLQICKMVLNYHICGDKYYLPYLLGMLVILKERETNLDQLQEIWNKALQNLVDFITIDKFGEKQNKDKAEETKKEIEKDEKEDNEAGDLQEEKKEDPQEEIKEEPQNDEKEDDKNQDENVEEKHQIENLNEEIEEESKKKDEEVKDNESKDEKKTEEDQLSEILKCNCPQKFIKSSYTKESLTISCIIKITIHKITLVSKSDSKFKFSLKSPLSLLPNAKTPIPIPHNSLKKVRKIHLHCSTPCSTPLTLIIPRS
ncbi:unnamed protein product [Moneuplotes crassus]|uniref:Uncharacterized protein n=1 Tax=Euplotes crassus TaxID=5936 RepID=A0AAD2D8Z7_EUPCR|nr:unnamed protein product [Moneuplotes crassus]